MEQARLFIAIVLSFIIFFVWQLFFVEEQAVQTPQEASQPAQTLEEKPYVPEMESKIAEVAPLFDKAAPEPLKEPRAIRVNTPFYAVKISEKGAVFTSFVLKHYRESVDNGSPLKELIPAEMPGGTIGTGFAAHTIAGVEDAVFSANVETDAVELGDEPQEISFAWKSPDGVVIEKNYRFSPDTYLIGLTVTIKNASDHTIRDNLLLSLRNVLPEDQRAYGFEGPSALINGELEQVKIKKIEDKNVYTGKVKWVAIQDRYFMSSIVSETPEEAGMRLFLKQDNVLESHYVGPPSVVPAGTQQAHKYALFLGPRSTQVLGGLGHELNRAINFGMFDVIAKPCVWLLNFLYGVIPNYGIAIIILTLFTKVILWPLGNKSYKSMNEMKKIQPIMAEIREKYKNDKKKMNEELMGLYRLYKINPVGGCLPMVLQIPVFFALYRMLYEAIELRHAPFFLWINDLSAPDRLLNFGFSIPFMEPPYGIPVLTIIMGASMFLQQKMSPPPGDPTQAKMMMFLPIIFTFIFINFSSGLVLYWLVNNVLSIAQQYYISKKSA